MIARPTRTFNRSTSCVRLTFSSCTSSSCFCRAASQASSSVTRSCTSSVESAACGLPALLSESAAVGFGVECPEPLAIGLAAAVVDSRCVRQLSRSLSNSIRCRSNRFSARSRSLRTVSRLSRNRSISACCRDAAASKDSVCSPVSKEFPDTYDGRVSTHLGLQLCHSLLQL